MGRAHLPVKGARGPSQGKTVAQARWDNLAIQPRTEPCNSAEDRSVLGKPNVPPKRRAKTV